MMYFLLCLCLVVSTLGFSQPDSTYQIYSENRTFTIDYERDTFLKDGKPFRYISGCFHYPRIPHYYWRDRLEKMWAMGLTTFQTYVFWNVHNPEPGVYDFEGQNDVISLLKIAGEIGFTIILRPGPFIEAEWDFGGFPAYLMKLKSGESPMLTRTMDLRYISAMDAWFNVLLPKIKPLLYQNGGPIIIVQVENEYGYNFVCDMKYMEHVRDLIKHHLGDDVVLTTNNGASVSFLKCIPSGVMPSLDFGPGENPKDAFAQLRKVAPKGPLANSEYYLGPFDKWGVSHSTTSSQIVLRYLKEHLDMGASVNMNLAVGGATFDYYSGVLEPIDGSRHFGVVATSYNYDSPITEWGNLTSKFYALREFLKNYTGHSPVPVPAPTLIHSYGTVKMEFFFNIFKYLPYIIYKGRTVRQSNPVTMENMNQSYGFILYRCMPRSKNYTNQMLSVPGIRSRGYVLIDQMPTGLLYWFKNITTLSSFSVSHDQVFDIFVENFGRLGYGQKDFIQSSQGIIGSVKVGDDVIQDWLSISLNFYQIADHFYKESSMFSKGNPDDLIRNKNGDHAPSIFVGEFVIDQGLEPADTFIDMTGWTKGQVFINGFNVGRYWPAAGPQMALFVPKGPLVAYPKKNKIMILELESAPKADPSKWSVKLIDHPILDGPVH